VFSVKVMLMYARSVMLLLPSRTISVFVASLAMFFPLLEPAFPAKCSGVSSARSLTPLYVPLVTLR
jgi:hypothetical protein